MSALPMKSTESLDWTDICAVDDILPGTGVCALVADVHVAVFRTSSDQFFAIDNVDPKSGASVLARGLIGNLGDRIVVASPMYKNHFDLQTGECLESSEYSVGAYSVRSLAGRVCVASVPPA